MKNYDNKASTSLDQNRPDGIDIDEKKNLARGQIKVNNLDTERGEAGIGLMKAAPKAAPKSNLAIAGGAIMDEKNPNKNSLLKKKTEASLTQLNDMSSNSK
jgi:hypothetical protein